MQSRHDLTIFYSLSQWNGYVIDIWVYLQLRNDSSARDLFSEKSLTQFWCAIQREYPNLTMSLCASIRCHLPLLVGVRPVTSLEHQGWRRVFWEGPKFFKLCPILSNYVQHTFTRGGENFSRGSRPTAPLVMGLVWRIQGWIKGGNGNNCSGPPAPRGPRRWKLFF